MKKALLLVGLLFIAGCTQENLTWTPTPGEWQSMSPTDDIFVENLQQSWAKCNADYDRLYEEAVVLAYCRGVVSNEQQQIFATLTDEQLTICQAYLESRRNYPLDPKTVVLLRAVKTNLSADEYLALARIWTGLATNKQRFQELLREVDGVLTRRDQVREDAARYMETLQGNVDKSVAVYQRMQQENRDINREELLRNIEYELRGIHMSLEGH